MLVLACNWGKKGFGGDSGRVYGQVLFIYFNNQLVINSSSFDACVILLLLAWNSVSPVT